MKKLAAIEQLIIVDENSPWRNLYDFERFFESFCVAHGMEVDLIPTSGNANKKIWYISKADMTPKLNPKPMTFKGAK
jgi:hypothetical protein